MARQVCLSHALQETADNTSQQSKNSTGYNCLSWRKAKPLASLTLDFEALEISIFPPLTQLNQSTPTLKFGFLDLQIKSAMFQFDLSFFNSRIVHSNASLRGLS